MHCHLRFDIKKKIEKNVSVETRNAKHPPRSRPTIREFRALVLWCCIMHTYIYIYIHTYTVSGWIGLRRTDAVFSKTIRNENCQEPRKVVLQNSSNLI